MLTVNTTYQDVRPPTKAEGCYSLQARCDGELWQPISQVQTKGGMSPTQAIATLTDTAYWLIRHGIRETRLVEMPEGANPKDFSVISYNHC
ncbi:MAG: hypothetical protein Q8R28_11335 [Dehalococcoidia bacterium]|nr:hypothetical protein [Dehalococcoidia bacterium]